MHIIDITSDEFICFIYGYSKRFVDTFVCCGLDIILQVIHIICQMSQNFINYCEELAPLAYSTLIDFFHRQKRYRHSKEVKESQ